jgi:hypothetical protein
MIRKWKKEKVTQPLFFLCFGQYDSLSFTVVSNQGESEAFLRSQLRLLYELLLMVFGPVALSQKKQINFLKHQKFLQKLNDTMCWLSERKQSVLVEVTDRMTKKEKKKKGQVSFFFFFLFLSLVNRNAECE